MSPPLPARHLSDLIRLNATDSVAVARRPLRAGQEATLGLDENSVRAREHVPPLHKIALVD
ncbi:MAG: hypothetical protein JNL97_09885, partial [Verrucomicrobiales bacterium]|nr:hypothetical protein [Verrucomicrobiales bacterium]